jgi:hypothetical protein
VKASEKLIEKPFLRKNCIVHAGVIPRQKILRKIQRKQTGFVYSIVGVHVIVGGHKA